MLKWVVKVLAWSPVANCISGVSLLESESEIVKTECSCDLAKTKKKQKPFGLCCVIVTWYIWLCKGGIVNSVPNPHCVYGVLQSSSLFITYRDTYTYAAEDKRNSPFQQVLNTTLERNFYTSFLHFVLCSQLFSTAQILKKDYHLIVFLWIINLYWFNA